MAAVTALYRSSPRRPVVMCDYSPPRGGALGPLEDVAALDADVISVNYNPGRVPRADAAMTAHRLREGAGKDVVFTLAARDMNSLALRSHLLGASMLGLENVLIVAGEPWRGSGAAPGRRVRPTELMRAVGEMNRGCDGRGRRLSAPTRLCAGGAVDLEDGLDEAARLTHRKVRAGARFFVTQPVYDSDRVLAFEDAYRRLTGGPPPRPVFYGVQIPVAGGVSLARAPEWVSRQLAEGRSGVEIAVDIWRSLEAAGVDALYLLPPILPGGERDYAAAARFLEDVRSKRGDFR